MHNYRTVGLSLSSEIALPGLYAISTELAAPDVVIEFGEVPLSLDGAEHIGPNCEFKSGQFLLRGPKSRFLIEQGRRVTVALQAAASPSDIAIYLVGSVLGVVLHQRSTIVLHASAVMVGEKAVLFCGDSGVGKSTIAAAMNMQGYPLIADDLAALSLNGVGPPLVSPDGRKFKLWPQAAQTLGLECGPAVSSAVPKYFIEPKHVLNEAIPIGSIYALRELRPSHAGGIEKVNLVDATALLHRNTYGPTLIRRLNRADSYFSGVTHIASTVGVFHLTRELKFEKMSAVLNGLEAHWEALGYFQTPMDRDIPRLKASKTYRNWQDVWKFHA